MQAAARAAVVLWLVFVIICGVVISRSQFTTDLSAFFPRSPTAAQQLLLDQIRDGLASRLILVGIEGADAPARAKLSKQMALRLRADPAFVSINNGEPVNSERDQAFLFDHRYLLSPAVTPERFSVDGLRAALEDSIDLLSSSAGLLVKSLLPRDPTGEMVQLLGQFNSASRPRMIDDAWASRDGARALLVVQTRASGADIDAQQDAMASIRKAFDAASAATPAASLVMTGPGVFSVTSRDTIKSQVSRLSALSFLLIAVLLLLLYRSFVALALGFLPVITGVLAGVAAVSLGFGTVHGITLGFGTALIGEAVDYSIYLFVQSGRGGADRRHWIRQFWPTIRLGVLTSLCGFAALLLSGFPGLAQLGLYAIAGLAAAAVVTRFVLPHLLPENFQIRDVSATGLLLSRLLLRAAALRRAAILLLVACAILFWHRAGLWNDRISSLSPVSRGEVELDAKLRADAGAPDVRYLVVVSGANQEVALQSAERASAVLQAQVDQGGLAGFESPSRYLPSLATQESRRASLPPPGVLETRLAQAVQGLPVRAQLFAPFLTDVAAAIGRPMLRAADLEQTSMGMAVAALLIQRNGHWSALLPLTAPKGGGINAGRIQAALSAANLTDVLFVDLKAESDRLYSGYLNEAIVLSLGGVLAIIVLLLLVFRSFTRTASIIAPLLAAIITVTAGLALFGQQLIILHLVGLLLVAAVGSNYALFFDRVAGASAPVILPGTLASMLFANLTTVAGFGLLAFSSVPILQAMGVTVAPGVILALVYSAIFARPSNA
ncbi:MAG: MMPL family transporter [Burkholderiales bacterium]|nr:MMPL family transporter [Burkholderiales bacterium]